MNKLLPFFALLILSFFVALIYGEVYIPPMALLHPKGAYAIILERIRLPTVFAAAMIGSSLAVCGAVMQMLLRNPLMDPYVSGTASGGAFGAVLSYFLLVFNLPLSYSFTYLLLLRLFLRFFQRLSRSQSEEELVCTALLWVV